MTAPCQSEHIVIMSNSNVILSEAKNLLSEESK